MGSRRRSLAAVVAVGVAFALVAGCGGGGGTVSTPTADETLPLDQVVPITVLYSAAQNAAAALFAAKAKGYFKDERLDVTFQSFTGDSATVVPLLATGKADAISTSSSPGFFNGVTNNLDVKFVMSGGQSKPGAPNSVFLAKPGSGVTKVADLRGKKVALVGGAATVSGYYLAELLKQGGLSINDVDVVNLDFDSGWAAVQNGAVAVSLVLAPTWSREVEAGHGVVIGDMDAVYAKGSPAGVVLGPKLLKENRRAGVALVRALQRAASVDLQGQYLADPDIVAALADGLGAKPDDIKQLKPLQFNPDLSIDPTLFDAVQQFWLSLGALTYKDPLPSDRVIDTDLVQAASRRR